MRFAAIATVLAGAVSAKTVYSTDYITVTSCAPEVTNCPARSTQTYSSIYAVSTPGSSSYAASAPSAPYPYSASSAPSYPAGTAPGSGYPTTAVSSAPAYPTTVKAASSTSPNQGSSSVLTISTTTCVPTVIYSSKYFLM
jgi:hypothetical protein